jgi:hypothetical protein
VNFDHPRSSRLIRLEAPLQTIGLPTPQDVENAAGQPFRSPKSESSEQYQLLQSKLDYTVLKDPSASG